MKGQTLNNHLLQIMETGAKHSKENDMRYKSFTKTDVVIL
jgi:hypothetical protein